MTRPGAHAHKFEQMSLFVFKDFSVYGKGRSWNKEWLDLRCFEKAMKFVLNLVKAMGLSLEVCSVPVLPVRPVVESGETRSTGNGHY